MSSKARFFQGLLQLGSKGKGLVDDLLRQVPVSRGVAARSGPVIPKGGVDPRAASFGQIPDRIRQTSTGAGFRGRVPNTWPTTGPNVAPGTTVPRATLGGGNNPIVAPRVINPQGGLPKITAGGILNNSLRGLGAYGAIDNLRKGNFRGAATDALLMAPTKYLAGAAGIFGVMEGLFPASVADGTLTGAKTKATEEVKATDPLTLREQYGGSGDMDADDAATYNADTGKYTFNSDVVPPAPQLPAPPVPQTPASSLQDLPPSPEQVQVMDPFAYNLSVYGQGRQAAQSQEAQAKVRDLGLAIHKAKYPQFYQESYNPLMAATFPERYTKTPQDFVVEGGIQAPRGMITKDDEQAIIDANGGEVFTSLDQPTSVVEELLRQAAAKKKGG